MMLIKNPSLILKYPSWFKLHIENGKRSIFNSKEERMAFAIELSEKNIKHETGGPFGAAIFENITGKLVCGGINLVTNLNYSILHAENVAILNAQKIYKTYDLSEKKDLELYSSSEPCAMCIGSIFWSGIKNLFLGASDKDVRSIGFDEGPKDKNWISYFNNNNITVRSGLLKKEAAQILRNYKNNNGKIYNSE